MCYVELYEVWLKMNKLNIGFDGACLERSRKAQPDISLRFQILHFDCAQCDKLEMRLQNQCSTWNKRELYRPKKTNKTLMSDGETPLIREA